MLLQMQAFKQLIQFFLHLVNAERGCPLAGGIIFEGHQKQSRFFLSQAKQVHLREYPVIIGVGCDISPFIRIGSQIEQFRKTESREWFCPDEQGSRGALFFKNKFLVFKP